MGDRTFDAEAVGEFRRFLLELLEELEAEVLPLLESGPLRNGPAFGAAPGAAEAVRRYAAFHAATWRHLQYVRGTLHGLESRLVDTAASVEAAGGAAEAMFTAFGFGGADRPEEP